MKTSTSVGWLVIGGTLFGCAGPFDPGEIPWIGQATGGHGAATTTAPSQGGSIVWQAGGATSTTCSPRTNLVPEAATSAESAWINDNACGVQGAFYAYSDDGLDRIAGTADDSLQVPPVKAPGSAERYSPCANGSCCISGVTSLWPLGSNGTLDYTASVWGSGLGMSLNDDGVTKSPYNGPAKGFIIVTAGSLSGQELRIAYTQSTLDTAAPFVSTTSLGTISVLFTAVSCPVWAPDCGLPSAHPFDLQLQVVGGDVAGAYKVCIQSITPIL